MAWITPKTNWTANDYYDHAALNRVENNIQEVAFAMQYYANVNAVISIGANTSRTMESIEFVESLTLIEQMQAYLITRVTPPAGIQRNKATWKAGEKFSYVDANRLEINTKLLYEHYKGNSDLIPRCGMAISGEAIV